MQRTLFLKLYHFISVEKYLKGYAKGSKTTLPLLDTTKTHFPEKFSVLL